MVQTNFKFRIQGYENRIDYISWTKNEYFKARNHDCNQTRSIKFHKRHNDKHNLKLMNSGFQNLTDNPY